MDKTALVIVDMQNDYFPGGAFEQAGAEQAVRNAASILEKFRQQGRPVIHIRHEALNPAAGFFLPGTKGAEIHSSVTPLETEAVLLKHYPNSFRETKLESILQELDVEKLVVVGMMTLMCVDATVRAAFDLGFKVQVAHDACAARSLEFAGVEVPAVQVHAAFLAALQMLYAEVLASEELVSRL